MASADRHSCKAVTIQEILIAAWLQGFVRKSRLGRRLTLPCPDPSHPACNLQTHKAKIGTAKDGRLVLQDVAATIFDIIARKTGADPGSLSRLTELETLKLDSVDTIEVIFEIEEKFDISIAFNANRATSAVGDIKTVGDVVDLVVAEIGTGKPGVTP
jgi:acyl carrier protein